MALKTGTVTFTDTTTVVEMVALVGGAIQQVGWNGSVGTPSFELYADPAGADGGWALTPAAGWAFPPFEPMQPVTATVYARCTDLSGAASQQLDYFAWDES
jgi:predicted NodU family carbamoyl transferase